MVNDSKNEGAENRKLMKKSTPIILIGVLIMSGLSYFVISQNPSFRESIEADRPVAREAVVSLSVYEYGDKNATDITKTVGNIKLAFDLSSNVPIHIALLTSRNGEAPKILFEDARIPPGQHKHIGKAGDKFIYRTKNNEGEVKFCLVQADDTAQLIRKLLRPKNIWFRIPPAQCVQVNVE